MVKEMTGDLLRDGRGILCHQVNYHGVMGAGIAYAISEKLLTKEQYKEYQELCQVQRDALLGTVQFFQCGDVRVANMFCQNGFSTKDHPQATDYGAMADCFKWVRRMAERWHMSVSIPGRLGCGLAGGDWPTVLDIIHTAFDDSPVEVTIVYWEREQR